LVKLKFIIGDKIFISKISINISSDHAVA